jgi:hypothetical protein
VLVVAVLVERLALFLQPSLAALAALAVHTLKSISTQPLLTQPSR